MCGVAGIINFNDKGDRKELVEKMLSLITYRGPDESGIYHSNKACIGSVRLSIIDIEGGSQPLSDPGGRFWIVFNGEIFNYIELRAELEKEGATFSTHSDTEVLVQLYARQGQSCLQKLNGQFVFAIWDKQKEELFIARDRVGIRPLFYYHQNQTLTFASEIKSIFANENIPRELSNKNMSQIFTFWAAISPNTAFKDIYELPPGHFMTFSKDGMKIKKYWELNFNEQSYNLSLEDATEKLHELFMDAVKIRLRADVEVAAYLSGGIDSSATVSYIKQIFPDILNTFSIGFSESEFDESSYQKEASEYFGTRHTSINCNSRQIVESFPNVVWHSEIPILRTAPTPMYLLSNLVRQNNIKVVITGEGADEMLAGYNIFKESEIRRFWSREPSSTLRPLLLRKLYPYIPQFQSANVNILKMFFGYKLQDTDNPFYSHLLRWQNGNHINKYLNADVINSLNGQDIYADLTKTLPENFQTFNSLAKAQWLESSVFMSGYLLSSQGDRVSMAHSVEGRYPFLDYRLIEYCASLKPEYKLRGTTEKYILKKMVSGRVPESILRREKQAYRAPVVSVFVSDDTPEYVKYVLSEEFTKNAGIFDPAKVRSLTDKMIKTKTATEVEKMAITAIISTHLLYNQFVKGDNQSVLKNGLNNLRVVGGEEVGSRK